MKIKNTFLCRVSALALIAMLAFAGTAFAAESLQPRDEETPDAAAVQEAQVVSEAPEDEPQVRTFGTESEDAVRFEFTNLTGKDITYFTIYVNDGTDRDKENVKLLQEALIEQGFLDDVADGSYGPKTKAAVKAYREANDLSAEEVVDDEMLIKLFPDYDDGNILEEDDVIKADETVVIFFTEEPDEENAEEQDDQFMTYTAYVAEMKLADDENEYTLHTLATSGEPMEIKVVIDVAYIEYQASDSGNLVSTYDTENTLKHPPVQTYNDYDDGYYYYQEPVYYEPVYENPAQGADGCVDVSQALVNP